MKTKQPLKPEVREELLLAIKRFVEKNGRSPVQVDIERPRNGLRSTFIYRRYFGTWGTAIREAGFEVTRGGNKIDKV